MEQTRSFTAERDKSFASRFTVSRDLERSHSRSTGDYTAAPEDWVTAKELEEQLDAEKEGALLVPQKTINLIGAEVAATEGDRAYGWTITPKHSRRTYFLRAKSEAEQQGWMLAICEAQLSSRDHASNACVVQ
ncbi:hypothetical protein JZ751_004947 [Albula glossodonta]|uniref:PH domain-containing protein n=1 Tax=Albula glossodonta TaxID=121402 RepID=A0A8T2P699_9TELE|nr:hypothetical protein JZ751_004947 [Albula glossodonta]